MGLLELRDDVDGFREEEELRLILQQKVLGLAWEFLQQNPQYELTKLESYFVQLWDIAKPGQDLPKCPVCQSTDENCLGHTWRIF